MTTAATTAFASDSILAAGLPFHFDGNSKITAGNGTFENPAPNAFSLLQIDDCPWRTPTCEAACYVHNLEEHQPELHALYRDNSRNMRYALSHGHGLAVARAFAEWISKNAAGGFRWHVSGDVFSAYYAKFIVEVCNLSPDVQHWIYTRSFPCVPVLLCADNLTVNISADQDNYEEARSTADMYGLRVCYLTVSGEVPQDLRWGEDVIFPDYGLRGVDMKPHDYREGSNWWVMLRSAHRRMVCPVDVYGKSENCRCGPCAKCL